MKLGARCFVSDRELYNGGVPKSHIEKRIERNLANSLAEKIVEKDIIRTMMSRKETDHLYHHGGVDYTLECYVLTPEQHKEYEELKKFQYQFKTFVK
jgi:hypothetical protein